MNGEPFIPLPKQRHNKPLMPVQLLMLWLMWACGVTAGLIVFLVELKAGVKERHKEVRKIAWTRRQDNHPKAKIKPRVRESIL